MDKICIFERKTQKYRKFVAKCGCGMLYLHGGENMAINDKEKEALKIVGQHKEMSISALAKAMFVSTSTVRRILHSLEGKNLIIHSYGKVQLNRLHAGYTTPYQTRDTWMYDVKEALAQAVIESGWIENGNVIMLDASSTVSHLTNYLKGFVDITVITSGIRSLCMLDDLEIPFVSTGGIPVLKSHSFTGQHALDVIRAYNADICFISCHGLSADGFATDPSAPENDVRRAMLKQSRKKILLLDGTKIDKTCLHNLCHVREFDAVFCNKNLPEHIAREVKRFYLVKTE